MCEVGEGIDNQTEHCASVYHAFGLVDANGLHLHRLTQQMVADAPRQSVAYRNSDKS